ncbi:MAG: hypothetical protein FJZ10_05490 [Candidatus Omnitrophica bacterium]|nr:hypothetical protein [Candidatus Omnitrophota bacterium]
MKNKLFITIIILTISFTVSIFAQEQTLDQILQDVELSKLPVSKAEIEEAAKNMQKEAFDQMQAPDITEIEGTIDSIAEDESSIVVDKKTIIISSDLLKYSKVMKGDRVIVLAAETDQGMRAIGINFADQEQTEASDVSNSEETDSEDYVNNDSQEEEEISEEADTEQEPSDEETDEEEPSKFYPQDFDDEE